MSIVIVDDNKVNLFVIERILKSEGYTDCVLLSSARELYTYLKLDTGDTPKESVDLILMDIMMPDIDGIEACRRVQAVPELKDIPIIFVTALEDSSKLAAALDVGGIDYITKPINKIELIARIRVALRLKYEKDWHREQDEKIRMELDLATQVQTSLLSPPVNEEKINISASYSPSFKLAGDMYYWHKIDKDRYGIILLDMMGHGISSSLVCMFISSVLRDSIRSIVDPARVIKELNRWMSFLSKQTNQLNYYFTAIYMTVDTKNKTVEYVNAGHPPGFALIDGEKVVPMSQKNCAVGFFENMDFEKSAIQYKDQLQIMLYTDGVMEAIDECGLDGMEKIMDASSIPHHHDSEINPIDLIITPECQITQHDDMCVVLIQAH
ncbi:SpoIIE family protein phosphatase [Heyndrickxia acidicola]|uniref:Fused response regulator/phosphatase n=1 Tax=Heyndrickxia acidicola TaxID=209389 RepID=A0ABU6MG51_9BACI|nr:fused response regulator/phosphatase [Heyndrickxia acidicola]MED1202648.1 fused response regulator/phosphatase [Heyndrickxia acidicola]